MIFLVDHEAKCFLPIQHQSAAGALGGMLAADEMAFHQHLLVQSGQTIHGPRERSLHLRQSLNGGSDHLQDANPLGLLGPAREGGCLEVPGEPDAAGHDNPIMRPLAARALRRRDEKDVKLHGVQVAAGLEARAVVCLISSRRMAASSKSSRSMALVSFFWRSLRRSDKSRFWRRASGTLPTCRVPLCIVLSRPPSGSAKVS